VSKIFYIGFWAALSAFVIAGLLTSNARAASSSTLNWSAPNSFYTFFGDWSDIFAAPATGTVPIFLYCPATSTITQFEVYDLVSKRDYVPVSSIGGDWYTGNAPGTGNQQAWNNPAVWETGADICSGGTGIIQDFSPFNIVNITLPADATTTLDFPIWHVTGYGLSTSTLYRVDVLYSQFGSSLTYDDYNIATSSYSSGIFLIRKNQPLLSPFASSSSWTAYATLSDYATGQNLATSTAITFTVVPIGSAESSSTFPAATTCDYTSTSSITSFLGIDLIGSVQSAVCKALVFVFIPNSAQSADLSARWAALGANFAKKPPFGYFTAIKNDLSSLQISTSTATTTLLDATGTAELSSVLSPLDTGLSAILWFLFGIWVFNRGRHFQF